MDASQALRDTENALRDFIASILKKTLDDDWVDKCGVSQDRIEKWKERRRIEEKRQEAGVVDERLIYYADFYDLKTILKKHWSDKFSEALSDLKTMEVFLSELEKLRDANAHGRELLPHQKQLILGIAGEIRNRLIRYRSEQETSEDYFARIETVRDSFGNIWTYENPSKYLETKTILRPGDTVEFFITASHPKSASFQYTMFPRFTESIDKNWWNRWKQYDPKSPNSLSLKIQEYHIKKSFTVSLKIRTFRFILPDFEDFESHHPWHWGNPRPRPQPEPEPDDSVMFEYTVLPRE